MRRGRAGTDRYGGHCGEGAVTDTVKGHASPAASAWLIMTSERRKNESEVGQMDYLWRDSDFVSG